MTRQADKHTFEQRQEVIDAILRASPFHPWETSWNVQQQHQAPGKAVHISYLEIALWNNCNKLEKWKSQAPEKEYLSDDVIWMQVIHRHANKFLHESQDNKLLNHVLQISVHRTENSYKRIQLRR